MISERRKDSKMHLVKSDVKHESQSTYEVQSGEYLYKTARSISEVGLSKFLSDNPPAPPFKLQKAG